MKDQVVTYKNIAPGILDRFSSELDIELNNILSYWLSYVTIGSDGNMPGRVDERHMPDNTFPKGLVLYSRVLWTFSAAYLHSGKKKYLETAHSVCRYLITHFSDRRHGGMFWSITADAFPLETRKQFYGIAFCIYGLSEYYRASLNGWALEHAKNLFSIVEQYGRDEQNGGYIEACTADWQQADDLRLSAKDENEKKTANTHLHILEAYVNLFRVWKDGKLKMRIHELLECFDTHIINKHTGHLSLFFDDHWQVKSSLVSYGHDIEAAWLLLDAAVTVGETEMIAKFRNNAMLLTAAATEGLDDTDGGLWYEYDAATQVLVREKHWWPQAEAMIGFVNAWQLSGDIQYLKNALAAWRFVQQYLKPDEGLEWLWGVDEQHKPMPAQDMAGFWKCPYHNGRACMELMKRFRH